MKKRSKFLAMLLSTAVAVSSLTGISVFAADKTSGAEETRTVVDATGAEVEVPAHPKRIAVPAMVLPNMVYALQGNAENMVSIPPAAYSGWEMSILKDLAPELEDVDTTMVNDDFSVNVEALADADVDLVLNWDSETDQAEQLKALGIPCVLVSSAKDMDEFFAEKWAKDETLTVKEALSSQISIIGENMNIRRFEKVTEENGFVASYIHAGGKIGVLVEADTANATDAVKECLKNVAMQIAALNPKYLSSDDVDAEYKEHEKEILLAQAKNDPKNANKPDEIIEKMITGRLNKELKEVCLLEQEYVKAENKENVKKYVESVAKAEGVSINLKSFVRFETGEGLEKKEEDFAAEVAAQMGN